MPSESVAMSKADPEALEGRLLASTGEYGEAFTAEELKWVVMGRGLKQGGESWAKLCPPKGTKRDILRRLRKGDE